MEIVEAYERLTDVGKLTHFLKSLLIQYDQAKAEGHELGFLREFCAGSTASQWVAKNTLGPIRIRKQRDDYSHPDPLETAEIQSRYEVIKFKGQGGDDVDRN
jgi:hypothetical protein